VFLTALAGFITASVGCAASPTLGVLIAFRSLQGLAGGCLSPTGMAIVIDLFPKAKLGRAMAVVTMALMMTPAIGPTVGGLLVTTVSWHWLFLINMPIGLAGLTAGLWLLPDVGHRQRTPLDVAGLVLGSGGLTLTVLGVSEGNRWGWTSVGTTASLVVGLSFLVLFAVHELRTPHPMLQLRILGDRTFRLAMGAVWFVTMAQFGRLVYVPLQLESLRGFSTLRVGLLLAPPAIFGMASTWTGGRMVDRYGPRRPIVLGCATAFVALVGLARLDLHTSLAWIVVLLVVQTMGMGLVSSPAMVAGLSELPPHLLAQGTALRSLAGQASAAVAIGGFGAVVATRMGAHPTAAHAQAAYNAAFVCAALGVAVSFAFATRLPRHLAGELPEDAVVAAALPAEPAAAP
jgi:EmrB/QacA subfamily drug resistance transporter